jgi:hypothetical protein
MYPKDTNTPTTESNDTSSATKDTNTFNTESKDTSSVFKNTNTFTTVDKGTPSDSKDNNPFTADSKDTPSATAKPSHNAEPPMIMSSHTPISPTSAATGGEIDPLKSTEKTGVVGNHTGNAPKTDILSPAERASNPGAAPASGAVPFAKHQGADKPTDAPSGEQVAAIGSKKDDAEEILKKRDPNDHSGEPMKMHDGREHILPATQEERRNSTIGNPGGQEHGKEPKGTGEQYIKSSGLAADGGDFDATKPGAGREAYRTLQKLSRTLSKADMVAGLLEERGIKKDPAVHAGEPTTTTTSTMHDSNTGGDKEKEKLGDKIKNKLHIGHKHK